VAAVVAGITHAGRRPVLLGAGRSEVTRYGGPVREIMTLRDTQDGHALTTAPKTNLKLILNVWMSEPSR
jgi:hypothetical protein